MWPNPQFPTDLVTFTEEIVNGKLHFLCSVNIFTNRNKAQQLSQLENMENRVMLLKFKNSDNLIKPLCNVFLQITRNKVFHWIYICEMEVKLKKLIGQKLTAQVFFKEKKINSIMKSKFCPIFQYYRW